MESSLSINSELFVISHTKKSYIIYAPLRKSAFIGNEAIVKILSSLRKKNNTLKVDPSLIAILKELEIISNTCEQIPGEKFIGNPKPTEITLFLTNNCNLRCAYCYADAGSEKIKMMPFSIARNGIDFIIKNAIDKNKKRIKLNFHGGGEPTTNWQVLEEANDYANLSTQIHGIKVNSSLATNGVLNDKQINWIIKNIHGCSVSFDGLPEIHDKYRITIEGIGSSRNVMRTLKLFDDVKYKYGIRLTVTHDSAKKLPDSIKFICSNFNPVRILAEPAYKINKWKNSPSAENNNFINAFRKARVIALEYGKELSFSASRLNTLTNHYCGVSQDSFSLTPDGNVTGCYEAYKEDVDFAQIFFYGKPDKKDGYKIDKVKLKNLRNHTVDKIEYCKGCFAKWHCAGDCYYRNLSINNKTKFSGSERCNITRELIKDQIIEKIYYNGGICWHEN